MSIYRDKTKGCFIFEFDRRINRQRIRARKCLPKAWNRTRADAFDREESARLYAQVKGCEELVERSIDDAVEKYITERCPELKNGRNVASELARTMWAWGGKPISQLPEACAEIAQSQGFQPATRRNRIRYLTAACRYAWKQHHICDYDPASRVRTPIVNNERRYYLNRSEMLQLAKVCRNKSTRAAIRIAFYSGMRAGEIFSGKLEGDFFNLEDTKNGLPRRVPTHPKIRTAFKALRSSANYNRDFNEARKKADMPWIRFHDLRHSAASEMINNGIDLYTVGAVLGHKSAVSTRRYAHLATQTIERAILKIGQKIPHQLDSNKKPKQPNTA